MLSAVGLFPILHWVALSAFVGVTAVSMLMAVVARMRLRRPLLAWHRSVSYTELPLGPGLFLFLVGVGFGHAWLTGRSVPPVLLVGYPAGGLFWGIATWMHRTVVVTEYGIVHDLGRGPGTVVWRQIFDYVVTSRAERPHFIFFYRDADGKCGRLDVSIPQTHAASLRQIVGRKLGDRFSVPDDTVCDQETLGHLDDQIDLS